MELCFIDTETTGLYPAYGDRICEIGLIIADAELHILDRFNKMINPLREISPEAQKVNKIEKWELESAPIFSQLVPIEPDIIEQCGKDIDVARHGVQGFSFPSVPAVEKDERHMDDLFK